MPRKGERMPEEERAKRRKSAEERRSGVVTVRFTQEQLERLDKRRMASGLSRSLQVVEDLSEHASPWHVEMTSEQRQEANQAAREVAAALNELTPQVGRLGSNLNQVAKRTNAATARLSDGSSLRSTEERHALAKVADHGPVVVKTASEFEALRSQLERLDKRVSLLLSEAGARW